jgi:hypothetical protein
LRSETELIAKTLDAALENLKAASQIKGTVQSRDEALAEVTSHKSPAYIGPLLLMLDDAAEDDESMFSLIHAAEAFDDGIYARELLGVLQGFYATSPRWASIVLMRVLNNDAARDELVRALRDASSHTKQAMASLCEKINERSPTFMSKTLPALIAARS